MRFRFRCLALALVALMSLSASVYAGAQWEKEQFVTVPGGTVISFWRWWDIYRNQFTIYKQVAGMRVYITVFGATYPEFKYYTQWDTTTVQPPDGGGTIPDARQLGYIGYFDMREAQLQPNSGSIELDMYMSDHFGLRWGKPAQVAFSIMPNVGAVRGSMPNVEVTVNNADVTDVKVVMPRPPFNPLTGEYTPPTGKADRQGVVTVVVNNNNVNVQNQRFGGGLGGIRVGGGFIGSGNGVGAGGSGQVESRNGIGVLICEPRRVRKLKKLGFPSWRIGGCAGGKIWTRGNIRIVKFGNGLGVAAGESRVANLGALLPGVAAGYYPDKMKGLNSAQPYHSSLYRVILPRGGNGGVVAAGSNPDATPATVTALAYDFLGIIGKVKINNRGGGYNANCTNCLFISAVQPVVKVKDITTVIDSQVLTVNGAFPIDPTYPRLK